MWLHCFLGRGVDYTRIAPAGPWTDIFVDLRNHGDSFDSADVSYNTSADDIINLLDSMNIQKATLIGHSLGGNIGVLAATKLQDRIERLVVLDVCPISYQKHGFDTGAELMKPVMTK